MNNLCCFPEEGLVKRDNGSYTESSRLVTDEYECGLNTRLISRFVVYHR